MRASPPTSPTLRAPLGLRGAALLACSAALCACGEVIELEASLGLSERNCQRAEGAASWLIRSIRVEVIEWYGGAPGAVRQSECLDELAVEVRRPLDLIDSFAERGYLARSIPTDVPTRVQLVGFGAPGCLVASEGQPELCAISQDTLSETGFSEGDTTRFSFSCIPESGAPTQTFTSCLGWGSLPGD